MRRILLVLVVSALVLAIAWFLAGLPGQVTAKVGAYTLEASTPVATLGLLLLFVVGYIVFRLLGALVRLPTTLARRREARNRLHGDQAVTRALVALAAGDKADARREAGRARRLLGNTPQTLLLAAEAGRLAGRDDETESAYRLLAERKDGAFLGLRGLLAQAIARQDWTEASELARRAEAAHPGASWLRHERAQLAIRAGHWAEALELGDETAPTAALAAGAAAAESDPAKARRLARRAWKQDPSLTSAALVYAENLRANNQENRARQVITEAWKLNPHPDLAAFVLSQVPDKLTRSQAVQRLTAENQDHPESRLLLARTALEAGLTGEARHHIDLARAAGLNERRLWLLLAELEEEERGDSEEGRRAQRDALRRAAAADPDPGWRCTSCHTPQTKWTPACPACATPGSMRWTKAPSLVSVPVQAGNSPVSDAPPPPAIEPSRAAA